MPDITLDAQKLGRYDIVRVLGEGAMGVVYEAVDPNLNRKVAIKTVRVGNLSRDEAMEYELRFRTEAHSAARLQHPNIVSVYDSDRDGNTAFLVMEFVKGQDLKYCLDTGTRYTLQETVSIICDLLAALEYAHEHKIIHRDVKPANMLIESNGRVKLADFGVARIQDSGEATRTQGGVVGTLKYMSPEQAEGKNVDARSDMFSAGVVLYQLLTDRRPFDGDSYFAIFNQIANMQPPPPSSINPRLPAALDAVIEKALAKDKTHRFETAIEFAMALRGAAQQSDMTVMPSANPHKFNSHFGASMPGSSGFSGYAQSQPSSTFGSASGTNSVITQELELVYWKDVKDSTNARDLEGFISRFPDGVYSELSKRQLERLTPVHRLPNQRVQGDAHAAIHSMAHAVSSDETRTSMFDTPTEQLQRGFAEPAVMPRSAQLGNFGQNPVADGARFAGATSLVPVQRQMQTQGPGTSHNMPIAKKSKGMGAIVGWSVAGLMTLLLACGAIWFVLNDGDVGGADVIMFSDVLKIIPKN